MESVATIGMADMTTVAKKTESLATETLRVDIVSTERSFNRLEKVWNDLMEQAGIDHPFLAYEWVRTWWESFGAGKDMQIRVVNAGERPIAIAPLMLSREKLCGLNIRRLGFIGNVHSPRTDFIIAERPLEAYRAIWRSLAGSAGQWDVLEFCQVPAGSNTVQDLSRLAESDGFGTGVWRGDASPYLWLRGSWEEYFGGLDRKHRSNLRNRLKRLNALGQVKLEVVDGGPYLMAALEEGLKIEAEAWKGGTGTAIRCNEVLRRFYTGLACRAAEKGWLRLQFLTVNGQRIAFGYSLCRGNKLYLLKPGYDPKYAPYSPCNLLCYLVLREAYEQGVTEYDFLGVSDAWKLEWTRTTRSHDWLYVFSKDWRMRLLRLAKFQVIPWLRRRPGLTSVRSTILETLAE